jgi:hypothetical protein
LCVPPCARSCNRSPHSMKLLELALPLTTALVDDGACRQRVASYADLAATMLRTLVAHLGHPSFCTLAADCLLAAAADLRMVAALRQGAADGAVGYQRRSLLTRLEGKGGAAKAVATRPVLLDKRRQGRLVQLLR